MGERSQSGGQPGRCREQGHDPARFLAELARDGYTLERLRHDGEAEALDPATAEDGRPPDGLWTSSRAVEAAC